MKKNTRRRRRRTGNPLLRVLLAAAGVIGVVLICTLLNSALPGVTDLDVHTETPAPTDIPTPSPEPTITPTPAVFAPFGAQYGHGGADLLPETPTPQPTPVPTPSPIAQPTAEPTPRVLRKGMSGEDVKHMQQALIDLGYLSDAADGAFGNNTYTAVVQFQAVNSLSADGIAGAKTLEALYGGHALAASEAPEMDYLILVNRENKTDNSFVPSDLVEIADVIPSDILKVKYKGMKANRTAVQALGRMLEDAVEEGIGDWQVSSAYRNYRDQQALVDQSVNKYKTNNPDWSREKCLSATYNTVAPAGASEHITGLAFDITVPGVSFTGTQQQKWLHEHCYEYGFIVRFTEEKQKYTGFIAESWHFRYVGTEAAQVMTYNDWCLEEYIEKMGI